MTSSSEIASWMLMELKRQKYLFQHDVIFEITTKYGKAFTCINTNGNVSINPEVLREFRKITENSVVWDRQARCWRFREDYDHSPKRLAE